MNLHVSLVRTSLLVSVAALTCCFVPMTRAQQDPDADSNTAATAKFPAAKRPPGQRTTVANTNAQTTKAPKPEKDGADTIRKREQWFRSEEHTSELQSHSDLVCRLLLEKKNKKKK